MFKPLKFKVSYKLKGTAKGWSVTFVKMYLAVVFIFLILAANLLKEKTPPVSLDHHAFRKAYANN